MASTAPHYPNYERDWATVSTGDRTFCAQRVIVRPAAVLVDESRNLLFVVERARETDARTPTFQDCLTAQITAAVVVAELKRRQRRRLTLRLYLAFPGQVRQEIEPRTAETRRLLALWRRRERLRKRLTCVSGHSRRAGTVPGPRAGLRDRVDAGTVSRDRGRHGVSDHDVFMNLIFFGLVYGVGYTIWFVLRGDSGDSIEDYLERHPKTLRDGRVHCYRCGSGSIYLRPVGRRPHPDQCAHLPAVRHQALQVRDQD